MRIPPEPILVAASRWLEILPGSGGIPRAQGILTNHVAYSDLTPTQYATALTWLRDVDLLETRGSTTPPSLRVMGAIFEHGALPWMQDADSLVETPDELPTDIIDAGACLGLSADQIHSQLVICWGKVDTESRQRVGAAGEAALAALLRERTSRQARVDQVSAISDGFGYDIDASDGLVSAHLEVKSTTRRGRVTIYLSRNEYEVMLRDESWVLVVVRLTADLELEGTGSIPKEWISRNAPRDAGRAGRWASCKLEVPREILDSTIPPLLPLLTAPLPPW